MWPLRAWDAFGNPVNCNQDKVSCPVASFFLLLLAYQTLLLFIIAIYYCRENHGVRPELSGQAREPYRTGLSLRGGRSHGRRCSPRQQNMEQWNHFIRKHWLTQCIFVDPDNLEWTLSRDVLGLPHHHLHLDRCEQKEAKDWEEEEVKGEGEAEGCGNSKNLGGKHCKVGVLPYGLALHDMACLSRLSRALCLSSSAPSHSFSGPSPLGPTLTEIMLEWNRIPAYGMDYSKGLHGIIDSFFLFGHFLYFYLFSFSMMWLFSKFFFYKGMPWQVWSCADRTYNYS